MRLLLLLLAAVGLGSISLAGEDMVALLLVWRCMLRAESLTRNPFTK